MAEYMWWGNARVTPWMYYRLSQLDADIFREFGVHIQANSGIRLASEQEAIWYARMTLTPNGRRVYSTRWWNGRLWYRISPDGEVAQPKTSNHEIQGDDAAVDIVDTGSDAGITSKNSVRGRWIRANAWKYDLVAEGDGFGEGWHYKIRGIFRTPPVTPTPEPPKPTLKEDRTMLIIIATENGTGDQKWISKGMAFADALTEPLTVLDPAEIGALDYWADAKRGAERIPYRRAEWPVSNILKLIKRRGIRPEIGPSANYAAEKVNY